MRSAKGKPLLEVAIYLRGRELDPNRVSQVIGSQPSRAQKKGGFRAGSNKFIAKIGLWVAQIESESRAISDLIDELIQRIGNPAMRLDQIEGVEDAHLDVFVASDDSRKSETLEFSITKAQITRLGKLGLSVYVTIAKVGAPVSTDGNQ